MIVSSMMFRLAILCIFIAASSASKMGTYEYCFVKPNNIIQVSWGHPNVVKMELYRITCVLWSMMMVAAGGGSWTSRRGRSCSSGGTQSTTGTGRMLRMDNQGAYSNQTITGMISRLFLWGLDVLLLGLMTAAWMGRAWLSGQGTKTGLEEDLFSFCKTLFFYQDMLLWARKMILKILMKQSSPLLVLAGDNLEGVGMKLNIVKNWINIMLRAIGSK